MHTAARRRLLFLDLDFHEHSRSSDFILELLGQRFDVTHAFLTTDRDDIEGCVQVVQRSNPDILFTWQVCLRAEALVKLGLPSIWAPMYDNVSKRHDDRFVDPARLSQPIIAFAKDHAATAAYWGLPCLSVQYFTPSGPEPDFNTGNDRVLIWYRGPVQPAEVATVLKGIPNLKVVIKHDPDPPFADLPRDDGALEPFIERVIEGFLPKQEYAELVASCGIYVAPRKSEGIGLSFLEAMARGALVVGFDAPTMNEYLRHGKTGWLFGEERTEPLNPELIPQLRRASYASAVTGAVEWTRGEAAFLDFISGVSPAKWSRGPEQLKVRAVQALKRVKGLLGS